MKITVNSVMYHDGEKWQVIFKTHDGRDYCRETVHHSWSLEEVKEWVLEKCREHSKFVGGADIQRWS